MKTLEEIQQALNELRNSSLGEQGQLCEQENNQQLVNTIPNFLDESTIDSIINKYESSKTKANFRINHYGFWGKTLADGSFGPVYMLHLDEYAPTIENKIWESLPQFKGYYPYSLFLHIWEPGSQINWHDDIHDKSWEELTTTIYLNKNWDINWGGLFLCKESSDSPTGQWFAPVHNQLSWFVPPVWHATTMCSTAMTEPRLSIQGFWRKSDIPLLGR
jgi:hypothetical protein